MNNSMFPLKFNDVNLLELNVNYPYQEMRWKICMEIYFVEYNCKLTITLRAIGKKKITSMAAPWDQL